MFKLKPKSSGRRGAVRKSKQRVNRRQLLVVAGSLTAVIVVATFAWQLRDYEPDTLMPIEHVVIEGNFKNLASAEMQARVTEVMQGGYFTVNLQMIRQALLKMPWVDDASVRRQWPPALKIRVTEKQAVAYWGNDFLISDKGELFAPQPLSKKMPLPRLAGPELQHKKVWRFAVQVSTQLLPLGMRAEKVSLDERRAWRIYVRSDDAIAQQQNRLMEINLGSAETPQRLQRFLNVFAMHNAPDLSNVQIVDMRYPNGFALRSISAGKSDA